MTCLISRITDTLSRLQQNCTHLSFSKHAIQYSAYAEARVMVYLQYTLFVDYPGICTGRYHIPPVCYLHLVIVYPGNSKWDWFVEYKSVAWAYLLHTWLSQTDTKIHVVQYERLVRDVRQELVKILAFLEVEVKDEDINCAVENGGGAFKRSKHLNFDPYSRENKEAVNRCITQAAPLLAKYGITYEHR